MNKKHITTLAEAFLELNNVSPVFSKMLVDFVESLIEKRELIKAEKEYISGCRDCADSIEMDCKGNQMCSTYDGQYCDPDKHREVYSKTAIPVNVISDEEIQRYITAAHPDTVGHKPLQLLMSEKIRVSLEWYREQLTNKA